MPPKLTKRNYKETTIVKPTVVQEQYGLEVGDEVRFRLVDEQGVGWSKARVTGEHKDGSLALYEIKTGHSRAIMPCKIEKKALGPRGGTEWVRLVPQED